jgi:glycosyltransferase involved in cell wall biosynthesis
VAQGDARELGGLSRRFQALDPVEPPHEVVDVLASSRSAQEGQRQPRVLYLVGEVSSFYHHRLPLARAAAAAGFDVHVALPQEGGLGTEREESTEFTFHRIRFPRSLGGPGAELRSLWDLYRLCRRLRPDVIHTFSAKMVAYGGIVARLARVRGAVHSLSGLGHVFAVGGLRASLYRAVLRAAWRVGFAHPCARVVFQNPDDREELLELGLVSADRAVLIRGSGVEIERFTPTPEPQGRPVVMLASRLLWVKGVGVFADAARMCREWGVPARFVIVGQPDAENPTAVPMRQLREWHDSGLLEWWGWRDDMPAILAASHILCLPSYNREGVPKILLEGAAAGRPLIATDMPGCREIVLHGDTGLLVPPRDAKALAEAIRELLLRPELRLRMGARARVLAVRDFSSEQVTGRLVALYLALCSEARPWRHS